MKGLFSLFAGIIFLPVTLSSQCTLANYTSAFKIPANGYPYFSVASGITVSASIVNVSTLSDVAYSCGGNSYAGASPAWWLNSTTGVITLNFSAPVSNLTILVNGTNNTEVFYCTAATGVVSLSNYCGMTATGGTATCNSSVTVGSLITINNPTGSTQYVLKHNGLGSGSRVTLLNCFVAAAVLPIELVSFKASCKAADLVELEWTTSYESNNDKFSIERSNDSYNWEQIGTIKSSGDSRTLNKYNFADIKPGKEIAYYRLKQIDFDGHYKYSKTVNVLNCDKNSYENISISPNPTTGNIVLEGNDITEIRIYNSLGQEIMNKKIVSPEDLTLDLTKFNSGVYFLNAKGKTLKILKN